MNTAERAYAEYESQTSTERPVRGCGTFPASALQCAKYDSVMELRCYARRAGRDRYIAECIDLDIMAEASTIEGAISGLRDAMEGYLALAFEELGTETPGLALRPSPLSHRLRYYFEYFKAIVRKLFAAREESRPQKVYSVQVRSHCRA